MDASAPAVMRSQARKVTQLQVVHAPTLDRVRSARAEYLRQEKARQAQEVSDAYRAGLQQSHVDDWMRGAKFAIGLGILIGMALAAVVMRVSFALGWLS